MPLSVTQRSAENNIFNWLSNKHSRECFPLFSIVCPFCVHFVSFLYVLYLSCIHSTSNCKSVLFPFLYPFHLHPTCSLLDYMTVPLSCTVLLQMITIQNWNTCSLNLILSFAFQISQPTDERGSSPAAVVSTILF